MHHWKVLQDSQKQEVDVRSWFLFDHKLNIRVVALAVWRLLFCLERENVEGHKITLLIIRT